MYCQPNKQRHARVFRASKTKISALPVLFLPFPFAHLATLSIPPPYPADTDPWKCIQLACQWNSMQSTHTNDNPPTQRPNYYLLITEVKLIMRESGERMIQPKSNQTKPNRNSMVWYGMKGCMECTENGRRGFVVVVIVVARMTSSFFSLSLSCLLGVLYPSRVTSCAYMCGCVYYLYYLSYPIIISYLLSSFSIFGSLVASQSTH